MIKIGIVGCGEVVKRMYFAALTGRRAYAVKWVSDLDARRASTVADMFRARSVPLDELTAQADVVIVSTPPSSHASVVESCIRPGITILCEKPFMTRRADAERLVAAASELGARLFVGHFRRLYPQVCLAREVVALGLIGAVSECRVSEGGRFTWTAASGYTTQDPYGGVLWDTGSHTLDMALYASALAGAAPGTVGEIAVERDKAEPSHDLRASFAWDVAGREIRNYIHVSRKAALPNYVTIRGETGTVQFLSGVDNRVRLTTAKGTTVLTGSSPNLDPLEYFELQCRKVLLNDGPEPFSAGGFTAQIGLLEALARA